MGAKGLKRTVAAREAGAASYCQLPQTGPRVNGVLAVDTTDLGMDSGGTKGTGMESLSILQEEAQGAEIWKQTSLLTLLPPVKMDPVLMRLLWPSPDP